MEDTAQKLEVEVKNLDRFKEILSKSNQQTKSMCDILTHFDERLLKLEETIKPVYKETGNLQDRQENIAKTLDHLNYVIRYFTVATEVEGIIRNSPVTNNVYEYLDCLDRLQNAIRYFEDNNPESPELMNVSGLYRLGSNKVEKEFTSLLKRNSHVIAPVLINDLINEDESLSDSDKLTLEHFPERVKNEIRILSEWLCQNRNDDFINVYSNVRAEILLSSIDGLRKAQRSSSGTLAVPGLAGQGGHSPLPTRRNVLQPIKESTPGRGSRVSTPKSIQQALRKVQNVIPGEILGRPQAVPDSIENPSITEQEIVSYLTCVTALSKLMQSELRLMEGIIPLPYQKPIFSRLVFSALESVVNEGDQLATRVKRCVARHDFTSALSLFPILRHQTSMRHCFELLFDGCDQQVLTKFQWLVVTLQTTINRALEEFIDYIKTDADTKVPKDGTVHELTNNVMIFVVQLLNYVDILSRVITITDMEALEKAGDKNRFAYANYITRVLSALGLTLQNKSEAYGDTYLRAIFKLNNTHYILKTLRKSSLIEIVQLQSPHIELIYEEQILDNKRTYSQSWSKVLHFLLEVDKPYSQQRTADTNAKMKDKYRQNIKDRFYGFNKEIEELRRNQTQYAIPDVELRQSLKRDNRDFIVPKYQMFYNKYLNTGFTKNPEKYVKYTPDQVDQMLDQFFDSAA